MKAVSFALNYIFADLLALNIGFVYAATLLIDFAMGYFINRYYVFETGDKKSHSQVLTRFVIAGLTFRGINWGIYMLLVKHLGLYILIAQAIATGLVLIMKYFVYRIIF